MGFLWSLFMTFQGHVKNGVVVFDEPASLPEGTAVKVEPLGPPASKLTTKEDVVARAAKWDAAARAVREIKNFDYEALREQDACDLRHADDHLP
jgi:hypothetical protein